MSKLDDTLRVAKFANLFDGNQSAHGGSDDPRAIYSRPDIRSHLEGINPIGIYPIRHGTNTAGDPTAHGPGLYVKWGCCDIDTGTWAEAYLLYQALQGMGLKPHVEVSRSKGWHVWVFCDEWIPARDMRRCLKVAYAAIDLPAKEANPKQEQLRPDQLGNYVRLPYPGGLVVHKHRQVFLKRITSNELMSDIVPFREFIDQKESKLYSDPAVIQKWAAKWYEPPRPTQNVSLETTPEAAIRLADSLPYRRRLFWEYGPAGDRSAGLVALGAQLARTGWNPQDVYTMLWWAPWNKYRDRIDGEGYTQDIVDRVFS